VRLAIDVIDQPMEPEEVDDLVKVVISLHWLVVDLFVSVGRRLPWSWVHQIDGGKLSLRAIANSIAEVVGDWAVTVGK
jgi:hypothetical protein